MPDARGTLILVIGPSGSGKSVLFNYVREHFPEVGFTLSYTTRERRPGTENPGYRFISVDEFEKGIAEGAYLEWAQFSGNYYGTRKDEALEALGEGTILMKEMEVQGVRQTLSLLPREQLALIYIDAGSWEELSKRVLARAPISAEELEKRKKRYEDEVEFKGTADFVIPNPPGELESAQVALAAAITAIKSRA